MCYIHFTFTFLKVSLLYVGRMYYGIQISYLFSSYWPERFFCRLFNPSGLRNYQWEKWLRVRESITKTKGEPFLYCSMMEIQHTVILYRGNSSPRCGLTFVATQGDGKLCWPLGRVPNSCKESRDFIFEGSPVYYSTWKRMIFVVGQIFFHQIPLAHILLNILHRCFLREIPLQNVM